MPEGSTIGFSTAACSDAGRDPSKQINEDAYRLFTRDDGLLVVVCDGMGGHAGGRLASNAAANRIERGFSEQQRIDEPRQLLSNLIQQAALEVYALGGQAPAEERPGSTCVVAWLSRQGLHIAHVGDSRAYRLRNGQLYPLTVDHTVVQAWIASGQLTHEQAKGHPDAHRITRALGVTPSVEVELRPIEDVRVGDRLLFCTDGLTDLVEDHELAQQLGASRPLSAIAKHLVELANQRGGHDNITVVLVELTATGSAATTAASPLERTAAATELIEPGMAPGAATPLPKTVLLETRERATLPMGQAAAPQLGQRNDGPGKTISLPVAEGAKPVPQPSPPLSAPQPLARHSPQQPARRKVWLIIAAVALLTLLGLLLRLLRHKAG
jgi:protein phosphatase